MPDTPGHNLRLAACFALVVVERGVNLALPIMQKNMINRLGFISTILKPPQDADDPLGPRAYMLRVTQNLLTLLKVGVGVL